MRDLEHRFPDELIVLGVHSGKYTAERETPRIREAALRLGNTHPVVNDRQFRVWRAYAVNAWPTIAVVDPAGSVVGMHAGEFTEEAIAPFIEALVARHSANGTLDRRTISFTPDAPATAPGTLRYPSKVAIDGERIAIADSGHHRVIVGRLHPGGRSVTIDSVAGDGERGFVDGVSGRLDSPQGMCFDGETLYIADAENHAVRALSLDTGALRTVAGIGRQLRTRHDEAAGALSSPWDVTLAGRTLYVAMAGNHQIWSIDPATGSTDVHAGSGREDIVDGPRLDAALAQPMGIVADGDRLYFVDAESSAVRWSEIGAPGSVGTIVGTGLFDFGDRDGVGDEVRMQHQQGIARHPSGRFLVADSYNDALKWVNVAERRVETWVRGVGLSEPGGVACGRTGAYVADTNAHRLVRVEWEKGEVDEVELK
ncbi:MAG: alkyl hydroperoxide reductase [Gemmatimonadaceae bacterium]